MGFVFVAFLVFAYAAAYDVDSEAFDLLGTRAVYAVFHSGFNHSITKIFRYSGSLRNLGYNLRNKMRVILFLLKYCTPMELLLLAV